MTALRTTTPHTMTRLAIETGMPFAEFRSAFERAAAPVFDAPAVHTIVAHGGSWDEVRAAVASNARNGLRIVAAIDATALTSVAGRQAKAVEYLLGNHVVAETMFRHDPKALLYLPLRILIHDDAQGDAVFCLDQPSTVLASFGLSPMTDAGRELDHMVAVLLAIIGVDAGDSLASGCP